MWKKCGRVTKKQFKVVKAALVKLRLGLGILPTKKKLITQTNDHSFPFDPFGL